MRIVIYPNAKNYKYGEEMSTIYNEVGHVLSFEMKDWGALSQENRVQIGELFSDYMSLVYDEEGFETKIVLMYYNSIDRYSLSRKVVKEAIEEVTGSKEIVVSKIFKYKAEILEYIRHKLEALTVKLANQKE